MNSSKGEQKKRNGFLAATAILAVFTLVFFRSVIFNPGGMIYSPLSDLVGQTFGWKLLIRETLWNGGGLALWNPHLMCGYPILGNLNYALLFPMHLLYLLLPTGPAASWTYLLTHFLAALAAWYFLRTIGIRNWGALLGALAYGFGVRNLGHLTNGFVGHLETLPFLPLAFAFTAKLARQRLWLHAAALALALAVILLSAFAQIFLYMMFILPLYFFWLVYNEEQRRWLFSGTQFTVALLLACGLAAVHLLPSMWLLPELSRSGELAPELYRLGSLPLRHFFTLVNPELFGRIGPQWSYFGSAYFWTLAFYTPLLLLPLAFLSFLDPGGRRHRNFFLALIPCIFLFAMGTYGPVYDFCHRFIPGVKLFREPARILFFHPLAMAVLAGFGWNGLRRLTREASPTQRRRAMILATGSALPIILLAAGYWFYLNGASQVIEHSHGVSSAFFTGNSQAMAAEYGKNLEKLLPRTLLASLVFLVSTTVLTLAALRPGSKLKSDSLKGLALLVLVADLLFFGRGYLQTSDSRELFLEKNPLVERLLELQQGMPPFRVADLCGALSDNQACAFGIDKVGGYDPINLKVTQGLFEAINNREGQTSAAWTLRVEHGFRRELLDRLNARYLLSREPLTQEGLHLLDVFEPIPVTLQNYGKVRLPGIRLYRNDYAFYRAWCVPGAFPPEPEGGAVPDLTLPKSQGRSLLPVHGITIEPNQLLIQCDFHTSGLLVVSQAWSAGWRAEDVETGEPLPVYRAEGMLTGIPVEVDSPVRKKIRLFYRPPGLRAGMALSTLSLLGLVALVLAGRGFRRPPAQTAKGGAVEQKPDDHQHDLVGKGNGVDPQEIDHQQQIHGNGQGIEDP